MVESKITKVDLKGKKTRKIILAYYYHINIL